MLIIGIIVALNNGKLSSLGGMIVLAVVLDNLLGLVSGYQLVRLAGYSEQICRTLAIEVGCRIRG